MYSNNETRNAIIESAKILLERGFLTAEIRVIYGDLSSQGFGGFVLGQSMKNKHATYCTIGGHFLMRVIEIGDVSEWDDLQGKAIRVSIKDGIIVGIGHIIKDDWFFPRIAIEEMEKERKKRKKNAKTLNQ
jgi:hypothetical protein